MIDKSFFGISEKVIEDVKFDAKKFDIYDPLHSESLSSVLREIQNVIEFTFEAEQTGNKMKIQMFNGENKVDKNTEVTHKYLGPELYIRLEKRSATGSEGNNNFFTGNCISGKVQHKRTVKTESPVTDYKIGLVRMDNQFAMTLKTKTIRELFSSINLLERALNVYVELIHSGFVDVCGVSDVTVNQKLENDEFYSAVIKFQIRTNEEFKINRGLILKQYNIMFGEDVDGNKLYLSNGNFKYDENGEAVEFISNDIIERDDYLDFSEGGFIHKK